MVFWYLGMVCVVPEELVEPFNLILQIHLQENMVSVQSLMNVVYGMLMRATPFAYC